MKSIIITLCSLFIAFSSPAITYALPVHYAATGTATDQTGQLLTISGSVDFDDQVIFDNYYMSPITDFTGWGRSYFRITGYSLQLGNFSFSGDQGLLYMELDYNHGTPYRFGDLMWFLENGHGQWVDLTGEDFWIGENFWFFNKDGTIGNPVSAYNQLSDSIQLVEAYSHYPMSIVLTRQDTAPAPEPSTFILLGAGLGGLVIWRRKIKSGALTELVRDASRVD